MPKLTPLISAQAVQDRVAALAQDLAPLVDENWNLIVLLQGAMPFAVDLQRALARLDRHPVQDCLWLESYRDGRASSGRVVVRADLSRSLEGRAALILDDVFDTGRTIAFARAHLLAKGERYPRAHALWCASLPPAPRISSMSASRRRIAFWLVMAWTMRGAIVDCPLLPRWISPPYSRYPRSSRRRMCWIVRKGALSAAWLS